MDENKYSQQHGDGSKGDSCVFPAVSKPPQRFPNVSILFICYDCLTRYGWADRIAVVTSGGGQLSTRAGSTKKKSQGT